MPSPLTIPFLSLFRFSFNLWGFGGFSAKIQGMKNAVPKNDKKRRKQLIDDVAKLEAEMEQKQREELEHLKLTSKESKVCEVMFLLSRAFESNCPLLLNCFLYKIIKLERKELTQTCSCLTFIIFAPGLHGNVFL